MNFYDIEKKKLCPKLLAAIKEKNRFFIRNPIYNIF